ncbi:MAG: hypothetical protein HC859_10790, partial [Bacteroidia bacterium]|nr:hypothetical protein [Bacteroidia bacterium]
LVNFELLHAFDNNNIHIDGIIVDSAYVFLTKMVDSDSSTDLNINILISRLNALSSGGTGKPPRVNIGEAVVNSSKFTYVDQYRDTVPYGFDYNHFTVLDRRRDSCKTSLCWATRLLSTCAH